MQGNEEVLPTRRGMALVDCVGPWSGSTPRARAGERRRYCHNEGPARPTFAEEGMGSM